MPGVLRPTHTLVTALTVSLTAIAILATLGIVLGLVEALVFPERALEGDPKDMATLLLQLGVGCQGLLYLVIYVPTIVLFCVFLHRSNQKARSLGAEAMMFTPGWTVGWFFVPFANLIMPYQAVREIYLASDPQSGPSDWQSRPAPGLLRWWWDLWLVSNVVGAFALHAVLSGNPLLQARSPWFDVIDGVIDVPLSLLALAVVRAIHRRQVAKGDLAPASIA